MKNLLVAVLFGLVLCTPVVVSQTIGFSQQGKVTHEMKDEGMSIAHTSLPLNSKARIANTSTGKEIEVTITRLIQASPNRIADVSPDVWQELGLSSDTETRIYTIVTPKPPSATQVARQQTAGSQASGAQAAGSQAAGYQAAGPQIAGGYQVAGPQVAGYQAAGSQPVILSGAGAAQSGAGSDALGNLPSGIKFENNNNFIINGNPAAPASVSSETQKPGAQPSVSYYQAPAPAPRPAQPVTAYEPPRPAQPVAAYEPPRPVQPVPANDMWAQIIKPAAAFDIRPAKPAATSEPPQPAQSSYYAPQSAQPSVTYYAPQPDQVRVENWTQTYQPLTPLTPLAPPQSAPSAVVYDTSRQHAQPVINIQTWTHEAPPAIPVEKLPEIRSNMVNEIVAPASRTFVFIDAAPETPVPSVTIDNGPELFRSVLPEQGRGRN